MSLNIAIIRKATIQDRFEIYIDENWWRDIHQTIFGKTPTPPKASSMEQWQEAFNAWEYQSAKRYAFWRLSKQSYHSEHLSKMLRERLVQDKTIGRLIEEIFSLRLIDDEMWIASYVKSQSSRCGRRLIQQKLRAKGISVDDSCFNNEMSDENESEAILHLLNTRYRKKDLSQRKEKQKVIASLMRKGFQYEHILNALTASFS